MENEMKIQQPSLLVIASYPPKGTTHHKLVVGGASYTKQTLVAMKQLRPEAAITVLGEHLPRHSGERSDSRIDSGSSTKMTEYSDEGISVKRVWQRGSLLSFANLFWEIRKHKDTKRVLLEFELAMFGEVLSLLPLPLFLLALRLIGKDITVVFHQVISDITTVSGHMNIKPTGIKPKIMNLGLRGLYASLLLLSHQAIVFDEVLKQRLETMYPDISAQFSVLRKWLARFQLVGLQTETPMTDRHETENREQKTDNRKIVVIPHAVESPVTTLTQEQARRRLGIPQSATVLITFGFVAWYKGTDWLVEAWGKMIDDRESKVENRKSINSPSSTINNLPSAFHSQSSKPLLVIAGGSNPNHKNKAFYQKYVANVERVCNEHGIRLTGFVPEEQMAAYFVASDLVLFPYRTLMSTSSPLALAFAYNKPFLVSEKLIDLFQTKDIAHVLSSNHLSMKELTFPLSNSAFDTILPVVNDKSKRDTIISVAKTMSKVRSWKKIGKQYNQVIFNLK